MTNEHRLQQRSSKSDDDCVFDPRRVRYVARKDAVPRLCVRELRQLVKTHFFLFRTSILLVSFGTSLRRFVARGWRWKRSPSAQSFLDSFIALVPFHETLQLRGVFLVFGRGSPTRTKAMDRFHHPNESFAR